MEENKVELDEEKKQSNPIFESDTPHLFIITKNGEKTDIKYFEHEIFSQPCFQMPSPTFYRSMHDFVIAVNAWKNYFSNVTSKYILCHAFNSFFYRPNPCLLGYPLWYKRLNPKFKLEIQEYFLNDNSNTEELVIPHNRRRLSCVTDTEPKKKKIVLTTPFPYPEYYNSYDEFRDASFNWYMIECKKKITFEEKIIEIKEISILEPPKQTNKPSESQDKPKDLSEKALSNLKKLYQCKPTLQTWIPIINVPFCDDYKLNPPKHEINSYTIKCSPYEILDQFCTYGALKYNVIIPNNAQFAAVSIFSIYSQNKYKVAENLNQLIYLIDQVNISNDPMFHFVTFISLQNILFAEFNTLIPLLFTEPERLRNVAMVIAEFSHSCTQLCIIPLNLTKNLDLPDFVVSLFNESVEYVHYSIFAQHFGIAAVYGDLTIFVNSILNNLRNRVLNDVQKYTEQLAEINPESITQENSMFYCHFFMLMMRVSPTSTNPFIFTIKQKILLFWLKLSEFSPKYFASLIIPYSAYSSLRKCLFSALSECISSPRFKLVTSNNLFNLLISNILVCEKSNHSISFTFIGIFISLCTQLNSPSLAKIQYFTIKFLVDAINSGVKNAIKEIDSILNLLQVEIMFCDPNDLLLDAFGLLFTIEKTRCKVNITKNFFEFVFNMMDCEKHTVAVSLAAMRLFEKILLNSPKQMKALLKRGEFDSRIISYFKTKIPEINTQIVHLLAVLIQKDKNRIATDIILILRNNHIGLDSIFYYAKQNLTGRSLTNTLKEIEIVRNHQLPTEFNSKIRISLH